MQRRLLKKWLAGGVLLAALGMVVGCDDTKPVKPDDTDLGSGLFENEDDVTVDVKEHSVVLDEAVDSLEVGSLGVFGGSRYFIALDDDPYDPEIDWDNELTEGSVISFAGSNEVRVVAMDDKYRVVAVWSISFPAELLKSSSSAAEESSSSADEESSSSAEEETAESSSSSDVEDVSSSSDAEGESSSSEEETAESSSSEVAAESSSSEEIVESSSSGESDPESSADAESSSSDVEDVSSSSDAEGESSSSEEESAESSSSEVVAESSSSEEVAESSSSEEVVPESSSSEEVVPESSSSEEPIEESSSSEAEIEVPGYVNVSQLSVDNATISVEDNLIRINVAYSEAFDFKSVTINPLEETFDLTKPIEKDFADHGVVSTYTVVAEMQLPGTDFASRVASFWGTTSSAMNTNRTVSGRRVTSSANVTFGSSKATLTSREVNHVTMGFLNLSISTYHGRKLAGGFYFAGSYAGANALDVYQREYESGNADDTYASDLRPDMTFGKPFTGRPTSFDVTYSYSHVANTREDYPQQDLIYVILASADNQIIASGVISDKENVESTTKNVELNYGSDNGLLESEFPIPEGLTLGTGSEDVATIYVMFASSAYAYVVEGGPNDSEKTYEANYRGGKNAQLILDNFKLNY